MLKIQNTFWKSTVFTTGICYMFLFVFLKKVCFIQISSGYYTRKKPCSIPAWGSWQPTLVHVCRQAPCYSSSPSPAAHAGWAAPAPALHSLHALWLEDTDSSKAIVHIPTKFFSFLCQAADFFQPWLRGTFGLQVLIPNQIGSKALLAVGDECIPALASCRVSFSCLAKGRALSKIESFQCGLPSHQ